MHACRLEHAKRLKLNNVQVYNIMVAKRQERNIITYSSLIAAADRAGRWEEGLTIWGHMAGDRCHPNLPAYNSAISCCAQGQSCQNRQHMQVSVLQQRSVVCCGVLCCGSVWCGVLYCSVLWYCHMLCPLSSE